MQQQLRARLGNEREGVRGAIDRLRRTMRDNPLPPSPDQGRLDGLAAELGRLAREDLQPTEPLLAEARKERGPIAPEARKSGPLPKAVDHRALPSKRSATCSTNFNRGPTPENCVPKLAG